MDYIIKNKNCFDIAVYQPTITRLDEQSNSFRDWVENITFEQSNIVLPNGDKIDGNIWINNQLQFDHGSYTNFIIHYYNDNVI